MTTVTATATATATSTAATSNITQPRHPMKDHEGLIPVQEYYFIVDCPSLHVIPGSYMGPRLECRTDAGLSTLDQWFCPQCQQVVKRARQIPSLCLGRPSSPIYSPPGGRMSPMFDQRSGRFSISPASRRSSNSYGPLTSGSTGMKIGEFRDVPFTFEPYTPPLPEPVSPQPSMATSTRKSGSVFEKASKLGFLSRRRTQVPSQRESPKSSVSTESRSGASLPKYLSFSFALSGRNLLVWKKDGRSLIRIELESYGGRLIDISNMLPSSAAEAPMGNIRFAAEGNRWISVLMFYNRRLVLLVLHSSGLVEQSSHHYIQDGLDPTGLAMSYNNSYIAIGLGSSVQLLKYNGYQRQWQVDLSVPDFTYRSEIKFQALSFSADNTHLIVSTQRNDQTRSPDDDSVSTYVWQYTERPLPPRRMSQCTMPTDSHGLVSAFYFPSLNTSFIAAAIPTPYPFFLLPSTSGPPTLTPNITDYRIRCACTSPPPYANIAYFMDAKNKVHAVNPRSRTVTLVADLNLERGALTVNEEPAAICASPDRKVRVFWRQGPALWICEITNDGTSHKEIINGATFHKNNLRGIWDDVTAMIDDGPLS